VIGCGFRGGAFGALVDVAAGDVAWLAASLAEGPVGAGKGVDAVVVGGVGECSHFVEEFVHVAAAYQRHRPGPSLRHERHT